MKFRFTFLKCSINKDASQNTLCKMLDILCRYFYSGFNVLDSCDVMDKIFVMTLNFSVYLNMHNWILQPSYHPFPFTWSNSGHLAVVHRYSSQTYTEMKMSSFWQHFHHWLHWMLSFWQIPLQQVMKMLSEWRHFHFSVTMLSEAHGWFNALSNKSYMYTNWFLNPMNIQGYDKEINSW